MLDLLVVAAAEAAAEEGEVAKRKIEKMLEKLMEYNLLEVVEPASVGEEEAAVGVEANVNQMHK